MGEVAFVTCSQLPDLDVDDRLAIAPLAELGIQVVPAVWDDPQVDWDRFDLSVVRSTWDYTNRRDEFVAWAQSTPRLANEAAVIAWNTDKRYLADLAAGDVPVIATDWVTSAAELNLPSSGEYVLKPSVGAGSIDTERFNLGDDGSRARAIDHATRLMTTGRTVMVQPFVESIAEDGETAVIVIDGQVSHAIRKELMLGAPPAADVDELYRREAIVPRTPSSAQVALARATLAAVPLDSAALLYARIDMVADADGRPMLLELELTEPSLFMATAPGSEQRFARAIANLAGRVGANE